MRALAQLVQAAGPHARRALRHATLRARPLGADERALLAMVAAAQDGQRHRVAALALWLVRPEGQDGLAQGATSLGAALADNDLILPDRRAACAVARERPERL